MLKLIVNGREMKEPAEVNGQKQLEQKAKAVKPANKSRKAGNK